MILALINTLDPKRGPFTRHHQGCEGTCRALTPDADLETRMQRPILVSYMNRRHIISSPWYSVSMAGEDRGKTGQNKGRSSLYVPGRGRAWGRGGRTRGRGAGGRRAVTKDIVLAGMLGQ